MKYNKLYIAGGLFLLFVVLPLVSLAYYTAAINRPAQGHKETSFEILEGESISSIAQRLYADELVNSAFLFKAHLLSKRLHTKIQAGTYRIPAGASVAELSQFFQHGTNDVRITFLEGWRVEEYARKASETFKRIDYGEFISISKEREGFLFPDTYFFNNEVSEKEMLAVLSETFKRKAGDLLNANDLSKIDLTEAEAVIFASIVEREVASETDRPIVAGILIDRWKNGQLIGADATTQYAVAPLQVCEVEALPTCPDQEQAMLLNWWPEELTSADLALDSPFNTRRNVGLPPKPISNPGLSAIDAVVNYQKTEYKYYLTDENGITHYAKTLEEHNLYVTQYL